MKKVDFLVKPQFSPPLDPGFRPAILANRKFLKNVKNSGSSVLLVLGLERLNGAFSRFETLVYDESHPDSEQNLYYAERLIKFLLWQRGGWRIFVGGPSSIGHHIRTVYSDGGRQDFDFHFMSNIYDKSIEVISCTVDEVPPEKELEKSLGRHIEGNRIGFDLGASDLKVSAVIDGQAIFSTEIEWQPRQQSDPTYFYDQIKAALDLANSKLPSLDAIGGSSAGVYINNRPMIASLYRGIPEDKFDQIHNLFLNIQKEMGVPLEIVNDGEVTALAGSMSLEDNAVLGIAMGSSEAAGYVTPDGNITDWLNELAFAPLDFNPDAAIDEWSRDQGVGASYFSQQCVFRLAPEIGVQIPQDISDAQKLKFIQLKLEAGNSEVAKIWQSMGIYLGYAIAHYADFYDIKHILILGRCTSDKGGPIILDGAKKVLAAEFPELAAKINIQLPDEKNRRVGQSIAAASLPELGAKV
ncbi:MAG: ROK family protein [Anaerolineaceae bacterium]|nr:ROK family protein [Anaerolineaceae bacterium]